MVHSRLVTVARPRPRPPGRGRSTRCPRGAPRTASARGHGTSRELPQVQRVGLAGQAEYPARKLAKASRYGSENTGPAGTGQQKWSWWSWGTSRVRPGPAQDPAAFDHPNVRRQTGLLQITAAYRATGQCVPPTRARGLCPDSSVCLRVDHPVQCGLLGSGSHDRRLHGFRIRGGRLCQLAVAFTLLAVAAGQPAGGGSPRWLAEAKPNPGACLDEVWRIRR